MSNLDIWYKRVDELYEKLSKSKDEKTLLRLMDICVRMYKVEVDRTKDERQLSLDEYLDNLVSLS